MKRLALLFGLAAGCAHQAAPAPHPTASSAASQATPETAPSVAAPPPEADVSEYVSISANELASAKIAGDVPRLPDVVKARECCNPITWVARIYVERDGRVSHLELMKSIPGASSSIVEAIRTWRFRPQPRPVRTVVRLLFDTR